MANAWDEASAYLKEHGFSSLYKQSYYPSLGKGVDACAPSASPDA